MGQRGKAGAMRARSPTLAPRFIKLDASSISIDPHFAYNKKPILHEKDGQNPAVPPSLAHSAPTQLSLSGSRSDIVELLRPDLLALDESFSRRLGSDFQRAPGSRSHQPRPLCACLTPTLSVIATCEYALKIPSEHTCVKQPPVGDAHR